MEFVFNYLTPAELYTCCLVCKDWHDIIIQPIYWEKEINRIILTLTTYYRHNFFPKRWLNCGGPACYAQITFRHTTAPRLARYLYKKPKEMLPILLHFTFNTPFKKCKDHFLNWNLWMWGHITLTYYDAVNDKVVAFEYDKKTNQVVMFYDKTDVFEGGKFNPLTLLPNYKAVYSI